jgi:hypothetical protein
MRILGLVFALVLASFATATAQTYVRGHVRSDGTYVQGYWRSSPDHNPYNNYSFPGNTNPYTGEVATGNPETYLERYYSRSNSWSLPSYASGRDDE